MKQHRSNAGKRLAEEAKRTGFAAPGSDEAVAKKLMMLSEARRGAFAAHMDEWGVINERIAMKEFLRPPEVAVEHIAWEAFKAGEKFGRAQK
jgi:hypothetical protein